MPLIQTVNTAYICFMSNGKNPRQTLGKPGSGGKDYVATKKNRKNSKLFQA